MLLFYGPKNNQLQASKSYLNVTFLETYNSRALNLLAFYKVSISIMLDLVELVTLREQRSY